MDIKKVLSYIYNSKTSESEASVSAPAASDELQTLKTQLAESERRNKELMEKLGQAPQKLESVEAAPVAFPVASTPVIDPQLMKASPEQLVDGIYKKVVDDIKMYKSPKNLTDIEAFVYVAKSNGIPSAKIAEDIAKGNFDYS